MATFDFKNFFTKNKEGYTSEATNSFTLNEKRVEFNQQESKAAAEQRIMQSILSSDEGGLANLFGLLARKGVGDQVGQAGVTSGSPEERFWQFFTTSGFSKAATAGMMGNIDQESGFKGDAVERGGGGGFGIIQWTNTTGSPRRSNLEKYAASKGQEPGDFQMQMEYLLHELENTNNWITRNPQGMGSYPYSEFKTTDDPEWAAAAFCWAYERPAPKSANISGRKKWARTHFENFKNWTPSAGATSSATGLVNPAQGVMTSPFGIRSHPIHKVLRMHNGIDIAGGGLDIVASAPGRIKTSQYNGTASSGLGWYIDIDHGTMNGVKVVTRYGHLRAKGKAVGTQVQAGEKIGTMGTTGGSTGVHLHFEVHENGKPVDPEKYVTYKKR